MLRRHLQGRGIVDPRVLRAMAEVPRELFVSPGMEPLAYEDTPLPIGQGQTISQPYMVARMAQAARLAPGDRVLEVGAGTGYAAAVLGRIARIVYTVERHPSLVREARARLRRLGAENVHVRSGDGTLGWAANAPFDAILVAAGALRVPEPLRDQLATGGRLVIPVGASREWQSLIVERSDPSGAPIVRDLGAVRFVPLVHPEEEVVSRATDMA